MRHEGSIRQAERSMSDRPREFRSSRERMKERVPVADNLHGRDYAAIVQQIGECVGGEESREERMRAVVDILWEALRNRGVSWVGFYVKSADADEMVLGPRRDKPACSPIGMHGACGRCWREGRPLVIGDVRDLGEGYIACDPRDQSEIILPVRDSGGFVWGVLDLDSFEVGAFDEADTAGLGAVLEAAFASGS